MEYCAIVFSILPEPKICHPDGSRAQTFNPDSAAYTVEAAPAPAVQVAIPTQPSIRRDISQPAAAAQRPGIQPAPQGFGQHTPAPQLRRSSDSTPPAPVVGQQASLANLIKQFRT